MTVVEFTSFDYRESEKALSWVCEMGRYGYFCWLLDCGSDDIYVGYTKEALFMSDLLARFADFVGLPVEAVRLRYYNDFDYEDRFSAVRADGSSVAVSVPVK